MEELQAALMIAIASCPEVSYRFRGDFESITFRFAKEKGLELFYEVYELCLVYAQSLWVLKSSFHMLTKD